MPDRRQSLLLLALTCACGTTESAPTPDDASGDGAATPLARLVDVTAAVGLQDSNVSGARDKRHIIEAKGGGLGFLDVDGDGLLDLYVVNGGRLSDHRKPGPRNHLYRGTGTAFHDVTDSLGGGDTDWSMGCVAADVDNDGDPDLLVTNYGPNRLYLNDGGRLRDATAAAGLAGGGEWSTGAAFGDYDLDGDLDLYVASFVRFDPANPPAAGPYQVWKGMKLFHGPNAYEDDADYLYRNEGDGRFLDVSSVSGDIAQVRFSGFQPVFVDVDNDGLPDLYVANDSDPNLLYHNQGDDTFLDISRASGAAYSADGETQAGMGVAVGDPDGDGDFDLFVTHFSEDYNTLYVNNSRGRYADMSHIRGVAAESMSAVGWGTGFFDIDHDGDEDLFVANGHVYPQLDEHDVGASYGQLNHLWRNTGGVFSTAPTALRGPAKVSRGAAFGDVDNDGDLDVAILNVDDIPTLLRNDGGNRAGNWLQVALRGRRSNRDGVGAAVTVRTGARTQIRLRSSGASFLSFHEPRLHFGLGPERTVAEVRVRWPGGAEQRFTDIAANRVLLIDERDGLVPREGS